jgi:hypothetical protein
MFLIKDFASQQALAGGEQQFGYGRINPSVGVGALGPAGGNAVGDFAGSATPDVSFTPSDPGDLGSSRLDQGLASTLPLEPLDSVDLNLPSASGAGRAGGRGGAGGGGDGRPSPVSNTEPSPSARNPIPPPSVVPGPLDPVAPRPIDPDAPRRVGPDPVVPGGPNPAGPGPVGPDPADPGGPNPAGPGPVGPGPMGPDPLGPGGPNPAGPGPVSPDPVNPGGPNPAGPGPVGPDPADPDDDPSVKVGTMPLIGPNLINVWDKSDVVARSVEGDSHLKGESFVVGLENSNLVFAMEVIESGTTRNIHTGRDLNLVAASLQGNATLDQSLGQAAVLDSFIKGARISGTYEVSARDLLSLLIDSGVVANAKVDDQSFAMLDSFFVGGDGVDRLSLESDMGVHLKGIGNPDSLNIELNLASVGVRNSEISLGKGNDQLLIRASIVGDPGDQKDYGIDLDLPNGKEAVKSEIRIHAAAIGADRGSVIASGAGNDRIDILTAIDDYLEADLRPVHPESAIQLRRDMISLDQSTLTTGAGDDFVVLRGDVIDSTIDLGSGINQLFLQGELKGNSQIRSEQDYIFVQLPLVRRSEVLTDADDRWEIGNLAEIQNLDGRAGHDTLVSSGQGNQDAVAITSTDRGHVWSMGFESIESLDLGAADDIVLIKNLGGLSGQILAGKGIDTLDFSESWRAAAVDLHAGTSSHVSKGIDSIEKVIGSDFDDAITLDWAPWLAEWDALGNGYDITGGKGADVFTVLGVGADIPEQWNGTSGLPVFRDVDLDGGDRFAYSMDYNLDSVLMTEPDADHLPAAKQLPIAPLEALRNGWQQNGFGLGLAIHESGHADPFSAELHLLGSEGPGTSRLIAYTTFSESSTGASGIKEGTESITD